jgi:hypothetical protein
MHCTHGAGASIRRSSSIPEKLLLSTNHGYDACRVLTAKFFSWGQPSGHLFHFKINSLPESLRQMRGAGKHSQNRQPNTPRLRMSGG